MTTPNIRFINLQDEKVLHAEVKYMNDEKQPFEKPDIREIEVLMVSYES